MGAMLRQEIIPKDGKSEQRSACHLNINKVASVKLKNNDCGREWQD
jgi:hypothetical protein